MVTTSFTSVRATLGSNIPLLGAVISSMALALGVVVPMPTFCAMILFTKMMVSKKNNNFFIALFYGFTIIILNSRVFVFIAPEYIS